MVHWENRCDDSLIDITENGLEKDDVTCLKFSNLFNTKMLKKLSARDYSFIYSESSVSKVDQDALSVVESFGYLRDV